MTDIELTLNQLAEVMTTALSKQKQPTSFLENKHVAKQGGQVAKNTRDNIEQKLGHTVISPINAQTKELLETTRQRTLEIDDNELE